MTVSTMPRIGLGTWQLADAAAVVREALELGYRHIDTAQAYGNEAEIGTALAASDVDRDQVWLTTKIWNTNHAPEDVVASTEASLRELRTDHVDLLLIHWPVHLDRLEETLEAMEGLRERGLTRHIGVSNFTAEQVRRAAEAADVHCNQVEYHPFLDRSEEIKATREVGGVLTAYSPLARGKVLDDPVITNVAGARHTTPAQVALRWLLDQDDVVAIPKASSREHLSANLEVLDMQPLSRNDTAALDDLPKDHRVVDPSFSPDWD